MDTLKAEIAQVCARLIAEEGLDYGAAKHRALRQMGLPARTALPTNEQVEAALEEYLALFCADTQPRELRFLRQLALQWMERLRGFSPQLSGAVWRGTATRWSDIYLQLYCDDPKSAQWALLDQGVRYEVHEGQDAQGKTYDVLSIQAQCPGLNSYVGVHLSVHDTLARRGTLLRDERGRPAQGTLEAVERLLEEANHE